MRLDVWVNSVYEKQFTYQVMRAEKRKLNHQKCYSLQVKIYWNLLLSLEENDNDNDNDNDKPIKSLLNGKGLLPPVGLARLDS
jgi:hypothetical protein